jgi:hypothetical protein
MRVLAVDIGGRTVRVLATGQKDPRILPSLREMTPGRMVVDVHALAGTEACLGRFRMWENGNGVVRRPARAKSRRTP